MELILKNTLFRRLLMLLEAVTFLALAVWITKAYVAGVLADKVTAKDLELAVRLDPGNAEHRLKLGRLYQYSISDIQPGRAEALLRRTIQMDPYSPQAWIDLAAAAEFQGKMAEAAAYLQRADSLAPNIPIYQWPIANFYLLQGNVDEAFRHFKVVLAGTPQYDQNVFSTAWKASSDADEILEELIPERVSTEFSYLDFLLSQQRFAEAGSVWKRIMSGPEKFAPQQAAGYLDSLINGRRPEEAYEVWTGLQKKGVIRNLAQEANGGLLIGGDFEDEPMNMGFAWRIVPLEGVYAGLDSTIYHSPSHSLLVEFFGKQNVDYRHVFEFVKVSPGHAYRLQAFMKAEGITTESGPRLEVRDPYDPSALDKVSEDLTGSTGTWTPLLLDFAVGGKTQLIVVNIRRAPSRRLDSLVSGKVWLDDVRLTPLSKETASEK